MDEHEQKFIELNTKEQFDSDLYKTERKNRLTASNFGLIIKKRLTTSCHTIVKQILYSGNYTNDAMSYGKTMEIVAIKKLEAKLCVKVEKAGLFVDTFYGFLGATPDGKFTTYCVYSLNF